MKTSSFFYRMISNYCVHNVRYLFISNELPKDLSSYAPKLVKHWPVKPKAEVLHDVLGLSIATAKHLVHKYQQLSDCNLHDFQQVASTLRSFNIDTKRFADCPFLFTLPPRVIRENYEFLKECGAVEIKGNTLFGCHNLLDLSIPIFKAHIGLRKEVDVIGNMLSKLPDHLQIKAQTEFGHVLSKDDATISEIRNQLFGIYLSWKLELPFRTAVKCVTDSLVNIPRSMGRFQELIELLVSIGFDKNKVEDHNYVLKSNSSSLSNLIENNPTLLGEDVCSFLLKHPYLCNIEFNVIEENLKNLQKYGIPECVIRENVTLLERNPLNLLGQLKIIDQYAELGILSHNPKFPKLLDKLDTATIRLEALRTIDQRLITFSVLCEYSDEEYVKVLQQGKIARLPEDIFIYLSNITGRSKEHIRKILVTHPYWKQMNAANVKRVIESLLRTKFNKEQIFNGIHLVLYPVGNVVEALNELPTRPEIQPYRQCRKNPDILQLLLYFVEQKFNFTGCGVFAEHKEPHTSSNHQSGKVSTLKETNKEISVAEC